MPHSLLCLPSFPSPRLTPIPLLVQVGLSVAYSLIVPFPKSIAMQGISTYWNTTSEKFPFSEIFKFYFLLKALTCISSVQSHSRVKLCRPHGLQHTRPPCPSPTPGACSNSCPSSQWCHPTILSSVIPFSSCTQSLQHHGLFQWVNSSHEVAKVLEFQLKHQSFQWIFRTDFL